MNGKAWISHFIKAIDIHYENRTNKTSWTAASWTTFLGEVLDKVAAEQKCYVVRRRPDNQAESGEYLNIDGLFFLDGPYDGSVPEGHDPLVLPSAAIELENSYSQEQIAYCLWKAMCLRTPLRILICYQSTAENVAILKDHLEKVMLKGNLTQGDKAEIIVIIGDESVSDEKPWRDYYSVFEWQNNKFTQMQGLEW